MTIDEVEATEHSAGFVAHVNGTDFDNAKTPAWQQGWLDAYELGEFSPLAWLRQEAEV